MYLLLLVIGTVVLKISALQSNVPEELSARFLQFMNPLADPCNDFYDYACGNYSKNAVLPPNEQEIEPFLELQQHLKEEILSMLNEPIKDNEPSYVAFIKNYYKMCINEEKIEKEGYTEILDILKEAGHWPVLEGDKWDEDKFDWIEADHVLTKHGFYVNYLFEPTVTENTKNKSQNIIWLRSPVQTNIVSRDPKDPRISAYLDFMVNSAVLLGADKETAKKDMQESLDFQLKLFNIILTNAELEAAIPQFTRMSIADLDKKYPINSWIKYFNNFLEPDQKVDTDEPVEVPVPDYIEKAVKLINETPKRTIANYFLWKTVQESAKILPKDLQNELHKFEKINSGETESEPRQKQCFSQIMKKDPSNLIISLTYVKRHHSKEISEAVEDLLNNIRDFFGKVLNDVKWLDDKSIAIIQEKLKRTTYIIGAPEIVFNEEFINDFFKDLKLTDTYFSTFNALARFDMRVYFTKSLRTINDPLNDWKKHIKINYIIETLKTLVGHFSTDNIMDIRESLLQDKFFFDLNQPNYRKYGVLGYQLSEWISSVIVGTGRIYTPNGTLEDWLPTDTKSKFEAIVKCFVDKYSAISIPEINQNLPGKNYWNPLTAPFGLNLAYLTYEDSLKTSKDNDPKLLYELENLSNRQLFWLSFANQFCSKITDMGLKDSVEKHVWPPRKYLVTQLLKNNKYFARDFKCSSDSQMNPSDKCDIFN